MESVCELQLISSEFRLEDLDACRETMDAHLEEELSLAWPPPPSVLTDCDDSDTDAAPMYAASASPAVDMEESEATASLPSVDREESEATASSPAVDREDSESMGADGAFSSGRSDTLALS